MLNVQRSVSDVHDPGPLRVEFWTSVEYRSFMTGLIGAFDPDLVEARQKYLISNADYRLPKGALGRLWLRFGMYAGYPLRLSWNCGRNHRSQIRIVLSNPFFAPYLAVLAGKRSLQPVVQWVCDLYPDVLVNAGKLAEHSFLTHQLEAFVKATFRRCAANIFLGDRLLASARQRFGEISNAQVMPVGADGAPFKSSPPVPREKGRLLRILYCGNLGRMHEVDTLIAWLADTSWQLPGKVQLQFRAHGANYSKFRRTLSAMIPRSDVDLDLGHNLSEPEWLEAMRDADIALVTLALGAERISMPSKTYSAMVAGQAILAICASNSDLADLVKQHDCGWIVSPGDTVALRSVLEIIVRNPQEVLAKRNRSFAAGHQHYDVRLLVKYWMALVGEVEGRESRVEG